MNDGISLTHPPHLVAQRSKTRGLPLKLSSETDLPERSSNTKCGPGLRADCGSSATRISAACANEYAARQMIKVRIVLSLFYCCSGSETPRTAEEQLIRLGGRPTVGRPWRLGTIYLAGVSDLRPAARYFE